MKVYLLYINHFDFADAVVGVFTSEERAIKLTNELNQFLKSNGLCCMEGNCSETSSIDNAKYVNGVINAIIGAEKTKYLITKSGAFFRCSFGYETDIL